MKHVLYVAAALAAVAALGCTPSVAGDPAEASSSVSSVEAVGLAADAQFLPEWEQGIMDIHTISTGRGEATLIVYPDGTTELIDCGDTSGWDTSSWNGQTMCDTSVTAARQIANYIEHMTGRRELDYFLLTHLHEDHFGSYEQMGKASAHGYGLAGITELGEYVHISKIIDRGYPEYDFPKDMRSGGVAEYAKFVEYQVDSCGTVAEKFQIGSRRQFSLLNQPRRYDVEVLNIAANGSITCGRGRRVRPMYTADPAAFDENMFSTAQLYRYGDFRYYNAGDLPGGYWLATTGPFNRDFESQVVDVIGRPVDVAKASHHGCPDATNPHLLWVLRPNVIVFPCAEKHHPALTTFRRVLDTMSPCGKNFYPTSLTCTPLVPADLVAKFQPAGHIVVRVYPGGSLYQVIVLDPFAPDYRVLSVSPLFSSRP